VRETFVASTDHGGHDGDGRALRYLEWNWDPDPSDTTYLVDYAYLLREEGQPMRCEYDRHTCGLFAEAEWLRLLELVGFRASTRQLELPDIPGGAQTCFVAVKPDSCASQAVPRWGA
jgi:hypothetical protein